MVFKLLGNFINPILTYGHGFEYRLSLDLLMTLQSFQSGPMMVQALVKLLEMTVKWSCSKLLFLVYTL
jgi:hypothetical protein